MKHDWIVSVKVLAFSVLLLGLIYPTFVFLAGRALFPWRASGSLLKEGEAAIGSALVAQDFSRPGYFQPRPSAGRYDPTLSGGSNLAPTSSRLLEIYRERAQRLRLANPREGVKVPIELVAASASGLDPHLSLGAALWQVPRVARARGLTEESVEALVREVVESPLLGFSGEWRVNVIELNRRLDRLSSQEGTSKHE